MGMKPRRKRCRRYRKSRRPGAHINSVFAADAARAVLANALVAARKSHSEIVAGHCSHCGDARQKKSCCLLCALMLDRGLPTNNGRVEEQSASLLGVSDRFILDIVSGFDKDGQPAYFPEAKRLGASLRRKYLGKINQ